MASSIRSASSRSLPALALLGGLLVGAGPAVAAAKDKDQAQAKKAFESAQKAYQLGRFEEALTGYERALELSGKQVLLFNIGQCHRQAGRLDKAAFFYRRFLAAVGEGHPQAKVAGQLLVEIEGKQREEAATQQRTADAERLLEEAEAKRQEAESVRQHAQAERQKAEAERQKAQEERSQAEAALQESQRREEEAARARLTPTPLPPAPLVVIEESPKPASKPLTSRWWFWTGVGAAVVAAGAVTYVATAPGPRAPTTLDEIRY